MGCADSFPNIFAFFGGSITPFIYQNYGQETDGGLWKAFLFGTVICVLSLISAIILVVIDKIANKRDKVIVES